MELGERFWSKVEKGEGCWNWTAGVDRYGYGQYHLKVGERRRDARSCRAHRLAYEEAYGATEEKLDHECNNRRCVNPLHLRPMSQRENVLRSETNPVAVNARKTHCVKGHEFTEENTERGKDGRRCKTCRRAPRSSRARGRPKKEQSKSAAIEPRPRKLPVRQAGAGHAPTCRCTMCRLARGEEG
jgi:HNH endonuclease